MKPYKFNYYLALIFFICTNFIAITAYTQNDSLLKIFPPTNEYSFLTSAGLLFPLDYTIKKGKNIIGPSYGYAIDLSFNYSYRIKPKLKLITGLTIGTCGREYFFKIDDDDFPDYAWVKEDVYSSSAINSSNNPYIAVPLKLAYNIGGTNKHQSWFKLGVDVFYIQNKYNEIAYYCTDDSGTEHNIFNINYEINPDNAFKLRLNVGYEYRYQYKNYNQLIIGLNFNYNFSEMYIGKYEVFPDDSKYYGYGAISSNLSTISLEVGYSINNKKKQITTSDYCYKNKTRRFVIPDTMPNKYELEIGTKLLKTPWFPMQQAQGYAKIYNDYRWTPRRGFSMNLKKYFRQNMAYSIGLEYDWGNYFFDALFDKSVYQNYIPYGITFNQTFSNLIIPIGFQYNYALNNKSNLEFGTSLFASLTSAGNLNCSSSNGIVNSAGQEILLVNFSCSETNLLSLGMGIELAYTITTKNKNKLGIGCQVNSHFTSHYTMNVDLIQPDKTYDRAKIKFQPTYIQAIVFYSFTWKKKRFMKQNGY